MNQTELNKILTEHKLWLKGDPKGKRANLGGAYLEGAYLEGANLEGANLDLIKFDYIWIDKAALAKSNYIGIFSEYYENCNYGKLTKLIPKGKFGELLYG